MNKKKLKKLLKASRVLEEIRCQALRDKEVEINYKDLVIRELKAEAALTTRG